MTSFDFGEANEDNMLIANVEVGCINATIILNANFNTSTVGEEFENCTFDDPMSPIFSSLLSHRLESFVALVIKKKQRTSHKV
jgi:hypothetical protein